jgi:hypothetical protein
MIEKFEEYLFLIMIDTNSPDFCKKYNRNPSSFEREKEILDSIITIISDKYILMVKENNNNDYYTKIIYLLLIGVIKLYELIFIIINRTYKGNKYLINKIKNNYFIYINLKKIKLNIENNKYNLLLDKKNYF